MRQRLLTGVVSCLLCRDVERNWCSRRWLHRTVRRGTIPPGSPPRWPPWSGCDEPRTGVRQVQGRHSGGRKTAHGNDTGLTNSPHGADTGVPDVAMTAKVKDELSRVDC